MSQEIFVANTPLREEDLPISGDYVSIDGEDYYRIANFDRMRSFFMTLVSHSDHWLFTTSTGGLSAGRKNENSSLFPYYTDDKIEDFKETSGCRTLIHAQRDGKNYFWEPFSDRYKGLYSLKRNLYKNVVGNRMIFEEKNVDLGLRFQYSWSFSDKYGFVRKSKLSNLGKGKITVNLLDGFQNILPYGVNSVLQNERSNLVNAYKKNELDESSGLGLFLLSSIIVDKAEPSEALKATTVWSSGLAPDHYLLSDRQLDKFRLEGKIETEVNVKAEPGAYFIHSKTVLAPGVGSDWQLVAELNQDHSDVNNLIHDLKTRKEDVLAELDNDINEGTGKLKLLVGMADGLQLTQDKLTCGRHYTNVMFNIMRGGIFDNGYTINSDDFKSYASSVNKKIESRQSTFFDNLPDTLDYQSLLMKALEVANEDLIRICFEYLPLTFSRRHGDPSRPWNKFSIETRKEDGSKNLDYQGNWRDIFQNWEALALSYPQFINSMISKFVNASTIDGYNPYRIMRDGIDWEVIEPDDPWSYIGYWGDHQIIYLLRLLEISYAHSKSELLNLLEQPYFVYANVPYLIKSYDDIVKDPKDTIDFDQERESIIERRVEAYGAEGKMVFGSDGKLLQATLTEKLLVTLLAKLSNFIPEGGIWLNTQRPEWNDANNALVGNGVSMVTLYYIRRYLTFCIDLFGSSHQNEYKVNTPVSDILSEISTCLNEKLDLLAGAISDSNRKSIMDNLGRAGETYRQKGYVAFEGEGTTNINKDEILNFFKVALQYVDHSIVANKREDGLYHSYNLVQINGNEASIEYLYEMLEGQVSVLTSGKLNANEVLEVLDALKDSKVYREDQYSYILYPDRELPRFLDKNNIPDSFISNSALAKSLIRDQNSLLFTKDVNGVCHFNGNFTNASGLEEGLEKLKQSGYKELVEKEYKSYLNVFEGMFNHKAFTGRSGSFFGYEGLGSIYWHMVSKLLLAVQENIHTAMVEGDQEVVGRLKDHYYSIREGIGVHKSPELYGAYPTDPYSHTPANKGAQQPGMTGQVKEDILNRWAELGISVEDGKISFNPRFLDPREYLAESSSFEYFDAQGSHMEVEVKAGELIFTYCQVPVFYSTGETNEVHVQFKDGIQISIQGNELTEELSAEVFNRSGKIGSIRAVQN
jgi:hypothetical protein